MIRLRIFAAMSLLLLLAIASQSLAQNRSVLVGTWERFSVKDAQGVVTQPPGPPAFLIFSAEGYFSQSTIPTGRAKVNKPVDQLTREELLQRFQQVVARRGTYTIAGNVLTRKDIAHSDPNLEGLDAVQQFRIEGDTLILTNAQDKAEARFRRVK